MLAASGYRMMESKAAACTWNNLTHLSPWLSLYQSSHNDLNLSYKLGHTDLMVICMTVMCEIPEIYILPSLVAFIMTVAVTPLGLGCPLLLQCVGCLKIFTLPWMAK